MIDFLVVYLIFEGHLSNHFVILIENNVRCMFRAQITSPEPASPFSSGRTSSGRSESKESKTRPKPYRDIRHLREVVYPRDQETCPSEFCTDTRSKAVFFLTLPLIDVFSEENEVNSLVSDQPWWPIKWLLARGGRPRGESRK